MRRPIRCPRWRPLFHKSAPQLALVASVSLRRLRPTYPFHRRPVFYSDVPLYVSYHGTYFDYLDVISSLTFHIFHRHPTYFKVTVLLHTSLPYHGIYLVATVSFDLWCPTLCPFCFSFCFSFCFVFCLPQGCAPDVPVMQRILTLRGLVLTPEQDIHSWLTFASLCRVNKNFRISKKVGLRAVLFRLLRYL